MKIKYKGFTIETEHGDTTISTVRNGVEYFASIGCAEDQGLNDAEWTHTVEVPVSVIDRAYDLEDQEFLGDSLFRSVSSGTTNQ